MSFPPITTIWWRTLINALHNNYFVALIGVISPILVFFIGHDLTHSGYHLMDDHGLLNLRQRIVDGEPFLGAVMDRISTDFNIRLRPIWGVNRLVEAYLFDANLDAISVYRMVMVTITALGLYLFAGLWGWRRGWAVIFVWLSLGGPQLSSWWMRAPAEGIGMMFLALSLVLLALIAKSPKRSPLLLVMFFVASLFAALSKESFLVTLPALAGLLVWGYTRQQGLAWGVAIRKAAVEIALLLGIFGMGLVVILMHLSSDFGYAGVTGFKLGPLLYAAAQLGYYSCGVGVAMVTAIVLWNKIGTKRGGTPSWVEILAPLILGGLIVLINLGLYMKSGFAYRYLVPASVGLAIVAVGLASNIQSGRLRQLCIAILAVAVLNSSVIAYQIASSFHTEGRDTEVWLERAIKNTQPSDTIVFAAPSGSHYESTFSLRTYLKLQGGRENVMFAQLEGTPKTPFYASLAKNLRNVAKAEGWLFEKDEARDTCPRVVLMYLDDESIILGSTVPLIHANAQRVQSGIFVSYLNRCGN